jgi:DNA-binding NarL/FixJ family response regulator
MNDREKKVRFDSVVVASRHRVLVEGVRVLLDTIFCTVAVVVDEPTLYQTTASLKPSVAIIDLSLSRVGSFRWLPRLYASCPGIKVVVMSNHDEAGIRRAALCAGIDGFILKRRMALDLLPTVEAVLKPDWPSFDLSQLDFSALKYSTEPDHPRTNHT